MLNLPNVLSALTLLILVLTVYVAFFRRTPTRFERKLEQLAAPADPARQRLMPAQRDIYHLMAGREQKRWSLRELSIQLRLDGFGRYRSLEPFVKRQLRRLARQGYIRRVPVRVNARRHEQVYAYVLAG